MIKIEVSSKSKITKEVIRAHKRKKTLDREVNFNLPMDVFIPFLVGYHTQIYGKSIEMKITFDAMGYLEKSPKNYGDRFAFSKPLNENVYFEIKSSFSSNEKTYRITHTREYELFNFFLLCLIDQEENFRARFYLIPKQYITNNPQEFALNAMNGNADVNASNSNIEMSKTITKDFAYEYFGKYNVLPGTDYIDWINYLNSILFVPVNQNMLVNPVVNSNSKFQFKVNGFSIGGKNNKETIINLANYIGGITAMKIFPPDKIKSGVKDKKCTVRLNTGSYHINPNFNMSDVRDMVMKSQKYDKLRIEVI